MWVLISEGRWHVPEWTDSGGAVSPRQMLLYAGDRFVELAGHTAFVYAATGALDPEAPLGTAQWRRTVEPLDVPAGEGAEVWAAMEALAAEPLPQHPGTATA